MALYTSKHWSTTEWDCYQRSENEYAWDDENGRLNTDNEDTANLFKILDMLREWNPHWVINWSYSGYKSGYRTKEVNDIMGGVWNSNHIYGRAADIHESNTDARAEDLAAAAEAAAEAWGLQDNLELGIYSNEGWIHVGCYDHRNVYYA